MEIDDAKLRLREIYESYGFEERGLVEGELCFFIKDSDRPAFTIEQDEIEEFASVYEEVVNAKIGQHETCVLGPNFREQWVEFADPYRGRFLGIADRGPVIRFGDENGNGLYVEVGAPSTVFRNFYRDKGKGIPYFEERLMRRIGMARSVSPIGVFRGMLTVRVGNIEGEWNDRTLKESDGLIENCLFELAYLSGMSLDLKTAWPLSMSERRKDKPFRARERPADKVLPLKKLKYDANVTRFYQRAVSSEDAYIAFVSFYHILEYYFISVSDAKLYSKIASVFCDPAFSPKKKNLDKIISSVEQHSRESDETEMLKGVIGEFVEEEDIIEFLQRYESHIKTKLYSEKMSCFGYDLDKMQFKSGHIFGPVAKRIKTIRNALVHSSDRYERRARYVPGEEASQILTRELPLMQFLAERVIIATAQPVD